MSAPEQARRAQLSANLARIRAEIADGCAAAGRDPAEVTLVAVTKTYPASDVYHLAALGVTDVGENRDQEAAPQGAELLAVAAADLQHRRRAVGGDPPGQPLGAFGAGRLALLFPEIIIPTAKGPIDPRVAVE